MRFQLRRAVEKIKKNTSIKERRNRRKMEKVVKIIERDLDELNDLFRGAKSRTPSPAVRRRIKHR
jgi:hypothetical protein